MYHIIIQKFTVQEENFEVEKFLELLPSVLPVVCLYDRHLVVPDARFDVLSQVGSGLGNFFPGDLDLPFVRGQVRLFVGY